METKEIQHTLDTFSSITGLNVLLVDTNYRPMAESGNTSGDFCEAIHASQKCLDCCIDSDIESFAKATESGKSYVYTCPFGFYQAIVPVKYENELRAFLIISLVAEKQPFENWERKTLEAVRTTDPDMDIASLYQYLDNVTMYSADKLTDCTETLEIFAEHLASKLPAKAVHMSLGEAAKAYIKNNLHKKITLAALSMSLHCSTVTLTEHFRKEFGITVMQYVLNKRMELAKELLRDTELTVKDISYRCGFADVEYFSRCFRDNCGNSPARWRNDVV
jgi:AraC-like DNA-binding protein